MFKVVTQSSDKRHSPVVRIVSSKTYAKNVVRKALRNGDDGVVLWQGGSRHGQAIVR